MVAKAITVARGVLDTVPAAHAADTVVWFISADRAFSQQRFLTGQIAQARAATITLFGELALDDAPTAQVTFNSRQIRPYPPGNFRQNNIIDPDYITGELTTSWAHRDRLQQTGEIIDQNEGNIGPEIDTTYRLRIYGETGVLIKTYTDLTGTSQTYPINEEISDSGLGRPNESLRVILNSGRGDYENWQNQDFSIAECQGYGMFYGNYYGG